MARNEEIKYRGVRYMAPDGESCRYIRSEDTLPSSIKPPVIREEPGTGNLPPSVPSTQSVLEEYMNQMNTIFQSVADELRMARTGELPTPGGIPGEGMYYVTGEVAIQVATPNPLVGESAIPPDRIAYDTLTKTLGPTPDGYQRERIYDVIGRKAARATVINDGTEALFVITSPNGRKWSPATPIFPTEARTFFNVWELRLRSPTAGTIDLATETFTGGVYRVTEYDYWLGNVRIVGKQPAVSVTVSLLPAALASLQNDVQPVAGVPILGVDLVPVNIPTTFRTMVSMSNVGNFSAIITNDLNTQTLLLNAVGGPALAANSLYVFDILVGEGDSINFSYSATGGTIQVLRVQEIDAAVT